LQSQPVAHYHSASKSYLPSAGKRRRAARSAGEGCWRRCLARSRGSKWNVSEEWPGYGGASSSPAVSHAFFAHLTAASPAERPASLRPSTEGKGPASKAARLSETTCSDCHCTRVCVGACLHA
jgi:hypothetical protein